MAWCRSYCVPLATNLDLPGPVDIGEISTVLSPFSIASLRFSFQIQDNLYFFDNSLLPFPGGRRRNDCSNSLTKETRYYYIQNNFQERFQRFPFRFRYKGKFFLKRLISRRREKFCKYPSAKFYCWKKKKRRNKKFVKFISPFSSQNSSLRLFEFLFEYELSQI